MSQKSVLRPAPLTSASRDAGSLEAVIRKEEEDRAKYLAKKLGIKYLNLFTFPVESDALGLMNEDRSRDGRLAIIQKRGKKLVAAVLDPSSPITQQTVNELKEKLFTVDVVAVSESSLEKAWEYYATITAAKKLKKHIAGKVDINPQRLEEHQKSFSTIGELSRRIATFPGAQTSDLVELVISGALKVLASDIHFEAEENSVRMRYRVDGVLQDVAAISSKIYPYVLSRMKLLSGLKINVRDIAQDGRFTIGIDANTNIEVRTSVLPGPYGENLVMRVLNPKVIAMSLEDLGLRKEVYAAMMQELGRTTGIILTTGPTGSGKTTTLYAFLKKANTPGKKIITIEDPIEYHLAGIEQTQVAPDRGYTFSTGLRAILRQDPDVVLVGEIRDFETADIAMHSALTGHLVFATLHTNDAAGAIPRLINMGVNPIVIAPALNAIIAQRLVRRVCAACVKKISASKDVIARMREELKNLPKTVTPPRLDGGLELSQGVGCSACSQTGFRGRVGVFEAFVVHEDMEHHILQAPTVSDMRNRAIEQGMITMKQDGVLKVIEGVTTLEEVERVLG